MPLALVIYFWLPSTGGNSNVSLLSFAVNYKKIIKNKSFLVIAGLNYTMAFLMYSIVTFIPLHLSINMGTSEGMAGILLGLQGLAGLIVATRIKNIALRFNTTRLMAGGLFLMVMALAVIPFHSTIIGVAISIFVFGFGLGVVITLINTMITDAVQPEYSGAAISLFNTMNFAGQATSPVVLGFVSALLGMNMVFPAAAAVALLAIVAISFLGKLLPVTFK